MEPPNPSPALMLPALDLSSTPNFDHTLAYKKREAEWKRLVSETHRAWCLCGSYLNHFVPNTEPLKKTCSDEEGPENGEKGATLGGGDISDIVAGGDGGEAAG
nr:ORF2 [Torque teno felis virus]